MLPTRQLNGSIDTLCGKPALAKARLEAQEHKRSACCVNLASACPAASAISSKTSMVAFQLH